MSPTGPAYQRNDDKMASGLHASSLEDCMKPICAVCTLVLALGCGAGESHNSSQAGATERAGIANPGNQPTVTLSGCLQNADRPDASAAQPTGSAGQGSAGAAVDQMAAGRGSPGERFTLTN